MIIVIILFTEYIIKTILKLVFNYHKIITYYYHFNMNKLINLLTIYKAVYNLIILFLKIAKNNQNNIN